MNSLTTISDEQKAELEAASKPIIERGVPAAVFDIDQVHKNNLTFNTFITYVKSMSTLETTGLLGFAISTGSTKLKLYSKVGECTFQNFIDLARYIQSKEGQEYLFIVRFWLQLVCKAPSISEEHGKTVTPGEYAIDQLLNMQKKEYFAAVKAVREKHEPRISELREELMCLEEGLNDELNNLLKEFNFLAEHDTDM